jgi:hypothetical protein
MYQRERGSWRFDRKLDSEDSRNGLREAISEIHSRVEKARRL